MTRYLATLSLLVLLAALAGCGSGDADEPASTLNRAERDSVLADSPLPGAGALKGALEVADTAAVRASRIDGIDDR